MILGDRVITFREKLSLSKQELADLVGVTPATITNWENSKSSPTNINLRLLAKLSAQQQITFKHILRLAGELGFFCASVEICALLFLWILGGSVYSSGG